MDSELNSYDLFMSYKCVIFAWNIKNNKMKNYFRQTVYKLKFRFAFYAIYASNTELTIN